MHINVTGDPMKDSYHILLETKRIVTICETLKKRLNESDDIRLLLNLELSILDIKDCARSIFEQSEEHS